MTPRPSFGGHSATPQAATIVWFKRDLCMVDHPAHAAAAEGGAPVVPFVVEPEMWGHPDASVRRWRFVAASLASLRDAVAGPGAPFVLRVGQAVSVLDAIHRERAVARLVGHEETGLLWS